MPLFSVWLQHLASGRRQLPGTLQLPRQSRKVSEADALQRLFSEPTWTWTAGHPGYAQEAK